MSFLTEVYQKSIAETDKNLRFWEDHFNSLKSLDLNIFAEKLKVPTLVPIGRRIFFRGEIKHTNEVIVPLGAEYFAKCSVQQAETLRQHKIKVAQSKVDLFTQEKEYLESQVSFNKQHIFNEEGQEIVEEYNEEEDRLWREKHKENVKKYKQNKKKEAESPKETVTDEELWTRLEELELQEELENELLDSHNDILDHRETNTLAMDEEKIIKKQPEVDINKAIENTNKLYENEIKSETPPDQTHIHLLQQVLEKQNELENKLTELKNKERPRIKNEEDLLAKLEEIERLDDLEDEMDRLEELLESGAMMKTEDDDDEEDEDEQPAKPSNKLKKSIAFADEDDGETLELTFKHSNVEPDSKPYNAEQGIMKPSDIYKAYSHCFGNKTNSILKKSKYGPTEPIGEKKVLIKKKIDYPEMIEEEETESKTIIINDVVEKTVPANEIVESKARPTSLFKKKRMQNKS